MGGGWGADGNIIFGTRGSGLFRVSAAGGEVLTTLDPEKEEKAHVWPEILPGGRAVIFTILVGERMENVQIAVLDLETQEHQVLSKGGNPHYSPTGHIVFGRESALWAVPFDPGTLVVTGEPIPVLENVGTKITGAANFSFSDDGSLLYVPATASAHSLRILVWVDRRGNEEHLDAPPRPYYDPRISPPNGKWVAVEIVDRNNADVWIYDLENKTPNRLTRNPYLERAPLWTPGGRRVVFVSSRDGTYNLYWKAADGTGEADLLADSPNVLTPWSWSADGQLLIFTESAGGNYNIGVLSMEGDRTQRLIMGEEFNEALPSVSPDGRWIAYQSDESGQYEIYVRPFPKVDEGKWPISTGGGVSLVWAPDGRELFYRNNDKMMAAKIKTDPAFTIETKAVLFQGHYYSGGGRQYDVSRDGKPFLMIKEAPQTEETPAPTEIIWVQNWFEELKRLVPTDN